MTKILVVGLGSIGRRHLRNLVALGEHDVVLVRSHRSTLPDEELAGFPTEVDLSEALKKHRPDGVVIANPTALHLESALLAADTGCAILLEKPISHSLEGLEKLESTVERSGSKVLVGFQFRFHPALARAAQWIAEGAIGRIMSAHVYYGEYLPAWHPWEDYRKGYAARADLGGGVLLTQCHSLDYLPWLVGEAEAAWAFLARTSDLDVDVDDTAEIGLRCAGGVLAGLHLDFVQQPPSHDLQISGTGGLLRCDLLSGLARLYRAEDKEWTEFPIPENWERNVMFQDEMGHFLAVARGEVDPACTLNDGLRVMRIIAAAQELQLSGRLVSLRQ